MKQYAQNLEVRILKSFTEINLFSAMDRIVHLNQNCQITEIALQELIREYDRFKRSRKPQNEIHFYKVCYPIIAKWKYYWECLLNVEKDLLIIPDSGRLTHLKIFQRRLYNSFKKKLPF